MTWLGSLAKGLAQNVKGVNSLRTDRGERNLEAKRFQDVNSSPLLLSFVAFDKILATQLMEGGLRISEEVIGDDNDRMSDCHGGAFGTAMSLNAMELSCQVSILGMRSSPSRFDKSSMEPFLPFAGRAGTTFVGADVIAGAQTSPGGQMFSGWEVRNIMANFGKDDFSRITSDTGNSDKLKDNPFVGGNQFSNALVECVQSGIQFIHVMENLLEHKAMMGAYVAE